jgi:hypothetical protein
MCNGKHVVLDQNPRLATLFSFDGWRWAFEKPKVRELFKQMRKELVELFGDGEYFHVGFDESFSYPNDKKATDELAEFVKDLCEEVLEEGRTPMIWGDLFLHEPTVGISMKEGYEGNAPSLEFAEKLLSSLPKDVIVCDWQYFVKEGPWKSTKYLMEKGVKLAVCPWLDETGVSTAIQTAKEFSTHSFMQTTWNRIFFDGYVVGLLRSYYKLFDINKSVPKAKDNLYSATLIRKIYFADGDYEKSGWATVDVENKFSK